MLYRIYTEDKNVSKIEEIVAKQFPGFTIITCQGYWEGEKEYSVIIEICSTTIGDRERVFAIADEIKVLNNQQAVLVQAIACINTLR